MIAHPFSDCVVVHLLAPRRGIKFFGINVPRSLRFARILAASRLRARAGCAERRSARAGPGQLQAAVRDEARKYWPQQSQTRDSPLKLSVRRRPVFPHKRRLGYRLLNCCAMISSGSTSTPPINVTRGVQAARPHRGSPHPAHRSSRPQAALRAWPGPARTIQRPRYGAPTRGSTPSTASTPRASP